MNAVRPRDLTLGIAMLAVLSVFSFVPFDIPEGEEGPPAVIIWGAIVFGVLGLIAAFGLWQGRRWGLWLAIGVLVLQVLSALPGIPFAPNNALRLLSLVTVILGALSLFMLLRPASRGALTR